MARATAVMPDAEPAADEAQEKRKRVMLDARTQEERLSDIRDANQERMAVFAREIEAGKPIASLHPVVITDLDFALKYIDHLQAKES